MKYDAPLFSSVESIDISLAPNAVLSSFHWEKEGYSRPESHALIYAVENEGIGATLYSFEENIRCECTERDDPVYTDSCLELFLMPVQGDERYVNFEVNPNGVYLSQIGEKRENRHFIAEVTELEPKIEPFTIEENGKSGWGYKIFLSDSFISELYSAEYHTRAGAIKGNFYKCADLSVTPHYAAYFPVAEAALGFHNPKKFGIITFGKV